MSSSDIGPFAYGVNGTGARRPVVRIPSHLMTKMEAGKVLRFHKDAVRRFCRTKILDAEWARVPVHRGSRLALLPTRKSVAEVLWRCYFFPAQPNGRTCGPRVGWRSARGFPHQV